MISNQSCPVLILLCFLLPLVLDLVPMTSSCQTKCGTIEFPYPFGFIEGCYLDSGYKIECKNDSGKYVPFLSANNKEIVKISLPSETNSNGSLVIKRPVTTSQKEGFESLWNLTGLKDTQWFKEKPYALLDLEWSFRTKNHSFITSLGCGNGLDPFDYSVSCKCENTTDSGIIYANCACTKGFKGNPYLLGGCEDIDECTLSGKNQNHCPESQCVNVIGSYYCKYKFSFRDISIFGILLIVGSCLLILVVISVLYIFIKRRMRIKLKKNHFKRNGGMILQKQLNTTQGNVETTRVFSSRELAKATGNFSESRVLGTGGQGTVFKAMLIDGSIVAVKKSTVVDESKVEEFINELVILSQLSHRHIVKLLGCCLETQVPLLVYEFISNGTLFEFLHKESTDQKMVTWDTRLGIAIEVSEAIYYMHSTASIPIYHRDIKTTNIMLDEKFRAKVSDFGTSRSVTEDHTHLTMTHVLGTPGYVDPEYYQSKQYTDKSDVYSYGIVLVELITGEKPMSSTRPPQYVTLASYFNHIIKEGKVADTIDPRIKNDCNLKQVMAVAHVARRCLNLKKRKRPNMRQVSMELKMIRCSPEEMQPHECLSDDEEGRELRNLEAYLGVEASKDVAVTAPVSSHQNVASSSRWSDTEPLFPLGTQ